MQEMLGSKLQKLVHVMVLLQDFSYKQYSYLNFIVK